MMLRLFGRNVMAYYHHHIMTAMCGELLQKQLPNQKKFILTELNLSEFSVGGGGGTTLNLAMLLKIKNKFPDFCTPYVLRQKDTNDIVGTIWLMRRGGNDPEYRIRNIDAYCFDVYVQKDYRGNGCAGIMLCELAKKLYKEGIREIGLAVSVNNLSAIHAYKKVGFHIVRDTKFCRILKINIPYWKL